MSRRAGTKVLLVVAVVEVVVVVVVVVGVVAAVLRDVDVEIRPVVDRSLEAVVGSVHADFDDIPEFLASASGVLVKVRKSHAESTQGNELECKRERAMGRDCTDRVRAGRGCTGRVRAGRILQEGTKQVHVRTTMRRIREGETRESEGDERDGIGMERRNEDGETE